MAYSLQIADAVSATVGKFATLNNYQLAGHLANLDFWSSQVNNALDAVDGYEKRQRKLEQAQQQYISAHDTRSFSEEDLKLHREFPNESMYDLWEVRPDQSRIDSETLKVKRRALVDSFYRFMLRCNKEQLISKEDARKVLNKFDIGMEPGDFR